MEKLEEVVANLNKVLEAQKPKLAALEGMETRSAEQAKDLASLKEQVGTINEGIAKIREQIQLRETGAVSGLDDEVKKNGGLNVVEMIFHSGSRSRAIGKEYTEKRRSVIQSASGGSAELGGVVRDMSTETDDLGGFLVKPQHLEGFIEKLRAGTIWDKAGLTVYSGLTGDPVEIPIETGDVTIQDRGETEAPTSSDATVGMLKFTPKVMKSLQKLSERLIRLSPSLANQIVVNNITKNYGLTLDSRVLRGTGAANQARGVANTPGIQNLEIDTNGGRFTLEVAGEMEALLDDVNSRGDALKYIGNPRAFHSMKLERIAQFTGQLEGDYVFPSLSNQNVQDRLSALFLKTTQIPRNLTKGSGTNLTEVYYADWSECFLAMWEDLRFKRSDVAGDATGSAFTQSQVWIISTMEYDVQIGHPEAFVLVNDALSVFGDLAA